MSPADTALLVIDVQDKLLRLIPNHQELVRNIAFLIDAARLLEIPVTATEQYPKGLGPTTTALAKRLPERPQKTAFSCCAIPSVVDSFHRGARPKILLAGLETHVCVQNTAFDLLNLDFRTYIAADAVRSRIGIDHDVALRRLEKAGVIVTTAEAAVFEWVGGAEHPRFKQISELVKQRAKAEPEA
jgi:nicotinamidase-related amidase